MALLAPKLTPVDEDLTNLEKDLRLFKIEYEAYLNGGRPRPPADVEWRIEQMMKRYGERPAEISFAQRFRYNNLAQAYGKFREMFRKRLKMREEGIVQRHYGAAARAIEAERARKRGRASIPKRHKPVPVVFTNPEHELREVERLYISLQEARESAGDSSNPVERDQFLEILRRKTQELRKGRTDGQVEYTIEIEGGKPRLKARLKT